MAEEATGGITGEMIQSLKASELHIANTAHSLQTWALLLVWALREARIQS